MDDIWTDAGSCEMLHAHGRAVLRLQGLEIAVFAQGGERFALENSCPHAGASLCGGRLEHGQLQCPAHGLKFDLRTGHMRGTDLAVRVFPVREEEGRLQLRLPPAA